jgi:hypothetical protein
MKFLSYAVCAFAVLAFASCKDDNKVKPEPVTPATKGSVTMHFDNYVGSQPMELNSNTSYKNEHGDDFKVTRYNYYVSNIVLKGDAGLTYIEAESYHLVTQEIDSSMTFVLDSVPSGTYTSVQIMLGVDSYKNVSGVQTGPLDPGHGMFWTWNSGYIMAEMEGTSPQSTTNNLLSFHIGGFSGDYNAVTTVVLPFPQKMVVSDKTTNKISLKSDLLTWFKSPNLIDFSVLNTVASIGPDSKRIATNYSTMLTVTQVQ